MSDRVVKEINEMIKHGEEVTFEELKLQLIKDLQLTGIAYLPEEASSIDNLILWTADLCLHLIEKDFQAYSNLLYRIDVSPEKFIKLNEENTDYNSNEIAALLVVKKEIDKIRLRKRYS